MEARFSDTGRVAVIAPPGDLEIANTGEFREAMIEACATAVVVVVDLGAVTFMDSTALGVIVGGYRRCLDKGGELVIANASGAPLRVIEATGLRRLLGVPPDDAPAA